MLINNYLLTEKVFCLKNKISKEKLIYVSLISLFCIVTVILAFRIHTKVEEISSATAVVIHDITTTAIADRGKKTVFVTPSGTKYHLDGCTYLGENRFSVTKEEAINAGYESCSKCQP